MSDYWWGQPHDARRYHVFEGDGFATSLCGNWMLGKAPGPEPPDAEDATFKEGSDCKKCARKLGILDE